MGDHKLYLFSLFYLLRREVVWNKILTLTRVSKKLYFHNYFQENLNNIKNT